MIPPLGFTEASARIKLIAVSPILKVSNYVEAYRLKAKYSRDIHELDGRRAFRGLTEFINRRICEEVGFGPADFLVDIGCGDGCLLTIAESKGVKSAIGLSATEEEAHRLAATGLNVVHGLTHSLPLPDNVATVVVCNGVLLIVPRQDIATSLREIERVARRGARVWLGEIPRVPELADVPRHESAIAMLRYLLRRHGLRTFLGMCRRILVATVRGEPFILNSATVIQFYAEPEEFIQMASEAGLKLERYFPHQVLDERGKVRQSEERYNYLFVKP
jgi:ubiquinone/menaquinone biosynthesis C-methylase UbiE